MDPKEPQEARHNGGNGTRAGDRSHAGNDHGAMRVEAGGHGHTALGLIWLTLIECQQAITWDAQAALQATSMLVMCAAVPIIYSTVFYIEQALFMIDKNLMPLHWPRRSKAALCD